MAASVIVVGAGIIGASVAWHLSRGGASVTVVDSGPAGGIATLRSWAWINASWNGMSDNYVRLRIASMQDWRRLEGEVPGLRVDWSSALIWDMPPEDLRALAAERQAQGYVLRLVEQPEIGVLEPALADPPALAAHAMSDGSIEPLEATHALLSGAQQLGAELRLGAGVNALEQAGGLTTGVRLKDGTRLLADAVVLAAGACTATLARSAGVTLPIEDAPALLLWTDPVPRLLKGMLVGPEIELRQRADGSLLAAGDVDRTDPESSAPAEAEALMERIRRTLKSGSTVRMAGHAVGRRPIPGDSLPVLGEAAPDLWVAVTHSGVTLAPAIGRLLAAEVMGGIRDPLLATFRPGRFAA